MMDVALTGLIASRICHDLISPVGAIGNGLELLEMAQGAPPEETELIRQSADAATSSLKFMRIAFGAPGFEDMIAQNEAARILTAYLAQGRRTATWAAESGGITRAQAQLMCLAALTLCDTAPLGGALEVEEVVDHPFRAMILIRAPRIEPLAPISTPTPRDAHRVLLETLIKDTRTKINWDIKPADQINLDEGYARVTLAEE